MFLCVPSLFTGLVLDLTPRRYSGMTPGMLRLTWFTTTCNLLLLLGFCARGGTMLMSGCCVCVCVVHCAHGLCVTIYSTFIVGVVVVHGRH